MRWNWPAVTLSVCSLVNTLAHIAGRIIRINSTIVTEAKKKRRLVRLTSGDLGVFGRAAEELKAARAAGTQIEREPGVSAACAAAAGLIPSQTEWSVAHSVVLATGTGSAEDSSARQHPPVWSRPTRALYASLTPGWQTFWPADATRDAAGRSVDIRVEVTNKGQRYFKRGSLQWRMLCSDIALLAVRSSS